MCNRVIFVNISFPPIPIKCPPFFYFGGGGVRIPHAKWWMSQIKTTPLTLKVHYVLLGEDIFMRREESLSCVILCQN